MARSVLVLVVFVEILAVLDLAFPVGALEPGLD